MVCEHEYMNMCPPPQLSLWLRHWIPNLSQLDKEEAALVGIALLPASPVVQEKILHLCEESTIKILHSDSISCDNKI
jgi:hypothetical protein